MVGKAHEVWRQNCDCGDCYYCNQARPAPPDCGCCPGDGSICPAVCRHTLENPLCNAGVALPEEAQQ